MYATVHDSGVSVSMYKQANTINDLFVAVLDHLRFILFTLEPLAVFNINSYLP